MLNVESWAAFTSIVLFIAVIPGPNALLVLFTALAKNRLMALANVAGVAFGFIVHAFISALGLSLLIAQSSMAFMMLKWIGVAYLLWLGWMNLTAGFHMKSLTTPQSHQSISVMSHFIKGLLTNLLNPKIILFYLFIYFSTICQSWRCF
ncbi:LysE family translocator [Shewanella surugensis]|uniref:LysE family translocator n=1 Tax=Shewanella surugensis TaxID=212020 RepID=A0ABT0LHQ3_9GAMM|nr:LysE family translocator [Shewanella surugensis]MCL1127247.1 LysE family translocator [Shewanella surugensis]